MKNLLLIGGLLLNSILVHSQELPNAWQKGGTWAGNYKMVIEKTDTKVGKNCLQIHSKIDEVYGSGTIEQSFSAIDYRGKNLKLSAWVKTEDVKYWTALFIGFDDENLENTFTTEGNTIIKEEKVRGYHDWVQISTERVIPWNVNKIRIGLAIFGKGKVKVDGFETSFTEANLAKPAGMNTSAVNLGFEETTLILPTDIHGYSIVEDKILFSFEPEKYKYLTGMGVWSKEIDDITIKEVYLASEMNEWKPKDKKFLMKKVGNKWEISLPLSELPKDKTMEFKFVINGKYWVEPQENMKNTTQAGNWEYSKNLVVFK
jgi:hypothetical protein